MIDLGVLASDMMPYLSGAVAAYGGAVVQKVTDSAGEAGADATVELGRRLLRRVFASKRGGQVRDAAVELAGRPDDAASETALRARLVEALSQEPELVTEVAQMLHVEGVGGDRYDVTVTRSQGVQFGSGNTQNNTFSSPPPT